MKDLHHGTYYQCIWSQKMKGQLAWSVIRNCKNQRDKLRASFQHRAKFFNLYIFNLYISCTKKKIMRDFYLSSAERRAFLHHKSKFGFNETCVFRVYTLFWLISSPWIMKLYSKTNISWLPEQLTSTSFCMEQKGEGTVK